MARSNTVLGPARTPIFDPPGKKDSGRRTIMAPPIQEAVWGWGGDIHPEDLANASPVWAAPDFVLLGVNARDVHVVQVSVYWQDAIGTDTTTVELWTGDDGLIDTITLTAPAVGAIHNVDVVVVGTDRIWLEASSDGTTGEIVGHSLSYLMRYRLITHLDVE